MHTISMHWATANAPCKAPGGNTSAPTDIRYCNMWTFSASVLSMCTQDLTVMRCVTAYQHAVGISNRSEDGAYEQRFFQYLTCVWCGTGLAHNVFFLDHQHKESRESQEGPTQSHTNEWEASMVAAIALHMVRYCFGSSHLHTFASVYSTLIDCLISHQPSANNAFPSNIMLHAASYLNVFNCCCFMIPECELLASSHRLLRVSSTIKISKRSCHRLQAQHNVCFASIVSQLSCCAQSTTNAPSQCTYLNFESTCQPARNWHLQ